VTTCGSIKSPSDLIRRSTVRSGATKPAGAPAPETQTSIFSSFLFCSGSGGGAAAGDVRRRAAKSGRPARTATLSFLSCLPPYLLPESEELRPWRPGKMDGGATVGPLAGTRTHPSGSAPPLSGLTAVPESHTRVLPQIPAGGGTFVHVHR